MPKGNRTTNRYGDLVGPSPSHWKDNGCEVAPACLTCPLPKCRHDMSGLELRQYGISGGGALPFIEKREQAKDMLRAGILRLTEIASITHLSERTLQRIRAELYDEATQYLHPLTVQMDGKRKDPGSLA